MSGFSIDWLSLREPVDHRSVNADVRASFTRDFAAREHVTLTDIGCGSGSHLRSLAPHLGKKQTWRLVDYDMRLLDAAKGLLSGWADSFSETDGGLSLRRGSQDITVLFVQADLQSDLERILDLPTDAITSAAFFDLTSVAFIQRMVSALAARRLPLYTILTYDGRESWTPPHEADADMLAAFNAHQTTDKGFGPSAGPQATEHLCAAFKGCNYKTTRGDSPWRLAAQDKALILELANGIANAVRETGKAELDRIEDWLAAKSGAEHCEIGHLDLYARPA
jgi:hypothetical protein